MSMKSFAEAQTSLVLSIYLKEMVLITFWKFACVLTRADDKMSGDFSFFFFICVFFWQRVGDGNDCEDGNKPTACFMTFAE